MGRFVYRGPVEPCSPMFCDRQRELARLRRACRGSVRSYMIVYGGRQTGKTSLLLRLKADLPESVTACRVDFQSIPGATASQIYLHLAEQVAETLGMAAPEVVRRGPDLTNYVSQALHQAQTELFVLLLEELGALSPEGSKDLANVLRWMFSNRLDERRFFPLKKLMVVLSGGIELYELAVTKVSPLHNICEVMYLSDAGKPNAVQLVVKGLESSKVTRRQAELLGEAIYDQVEGHLYLTQRIGGLLEEAIRDQIEAGRPYLTPRIVKLLGEYLASGSPPATSVVKELADKSMVDDPLFRSIRQALLGHQLLKASSSLLAQRLRFGRNDEGMAQLELLGLAKEKNGYWVVRTPLMGRALQSWLDNVVECMSTDHHIEEPQRKLVGGKSKETSKIPSELTKQLNKGNVALFCGAGISTSEGGLPSGEQLAQELGQLAGLDDVSGIPLPDVAQAYELEMGHHSLISYLIDRIDKPDYVPLRSHHLIAALPFKRIITTNWDNLLEDAFKQVRRSFEKTVRDESVAYASEEKTLLIKLHGSIEQKDTLVVTGDDYYDVFIRLPEVANLVRSYFVTQTLLFVGFGLADEDFKRLYHEAVRNLGKHKRRAYAVQLDPDPITVKYWQQKNVEIINADATDFLEALRAQLSEAKPPGRSFSPPLPLSPGLSPASDKIIERLQRIEDKLDQGRAEDRQVAEQILNALAQNQVAPVEAAQMVNELNAWAQRVQQSGLPLNPELHDALGALTEHTGSAYQYLQLVLPIIPGILSYNVELGSEHQVDLRAIWEHIKARFGTST